MPSPLEIVQRFTIEFQSGGRNDIADELLADDFVDHAPALGYDPTRDGVKQLFAELRSGFPDVTVEIIEEIVQGDRVGMLKVLRGTHRGVFMSIRPTGRSIDVRMLEIVRVSGGRIAEGWRTVDISALLRQLSENERSMGPALARDLQPLSAAG